MKEHSISFTNGDEEHSSSIRIIKNICKSHKKNEIDQVFTKTYKKINGFYEEQDCILLYCKYQKINLGIKFNEVEEWKATTIK